jgi:hypothetical protein
MPVGFATSLAGHLADFTSLATRTRCVHDTSDALGFVHICPATNDKGDSHD